MNEQLRTGRELTGRGTYSRLNEVPFSNRGNFSMAIDPGNSESNRIRPKTNPTRQERNLARSVQEEASEIDSMLRANPDYLNDPEKFLREASKRAVQLAQKDGIDLSAVLSGDESIFSHKPFHEPGSYQRSPFKNVQGKVFPTDEELRSQRQDIIGKRYGERPGPEYITYNQQGVDADTEEAGADQQGQLLLRPITNLGAVRDPIILESIRLFNRQVGEGVISPQDDDGVLKIDKIADKIVERILTGGLNDAEKAEAEDLLMRVEEQAKEAKERVYERRLLQERQRRRESPYQDLINEVNEYKAVFGEAMQSERENGRVNNPAFYAKKNELVKKLRDAIKEAPSIETGHFPTELIDVALNFKETREQLINDIIFRSFEDPTEQGHFEINLYASGNLDQLLGGLSLGGFKEEYLRFRRLRTSAQNFYEMNKTIGAGNIEGFIRIAENINWTQFETMQQITGVPLVMRLFEQKYIAKLGEKKTISSEAYQEIKKEVEESLHHLNEKGLIKSEYSNERGGSQEQGKLEEWELERALNAGRAFFNITFRAAEQISLGQVPGVTADKGYKQFVSYPQESASRIMNPIIWTITRFDVANGKGGDVFNNSVKEEYKAYLEARKRNLGINRLTEVGGMSVEDWQVSGLMGISGVLSGWRFENLAYSGLRFGEGDNDNLRDWMDGKSGYVDKKGHEVSRASAIGDIKRGKGIAIDMTMEQRQDELVKIMKTLLEDTQNGGKGMDVGMGALLRLVADREQVAYKLRKYIWEKTSEKNLPVIISYLSNIKGRGHHAEEIAKLSMKNLRKGTAFESDAAWSQLLQKIELQREILTKRRVAQRTIDGELKRDEAGKLIFDRFDDVDFSGPGEKEMLEKITKAGKAISGDLADIYYGYMPFINDVGMEEFQFSGPGEEFYRRRSAGDLGSFYKAAGAYGSIVGNPGALKDDDALGKINEIEQGVESPNGVESGQDAAYPVFAAYLKFVMTFEEDRWVVKKDIKKRRLKPTSEAQKWNGVDAYSLNEAQAFHLVDKARHLGFLSHAGEALILQRRKIDFWSRIWEILRDFGPLAAAAMIVAVPSKAASGK